MRRVIVASDAVILTVHGPGGATAVYTCTSERDCEKTEADLESALLLQGYSPYPTPDRRVLADRRRFPRGERRRPAAARR